MVPIWYDIFSTDCNASRNRLTYILLQRGNPMGGIVFTTAFTGSYVQANEWHNFNGGNQFCFKACDSRGPNAAELCQHIYDTQGCGFNAPSNARDGVFESCAGDNQAPPGQGQAVPASSQCSTFASTAIYGASATEIAPIPGASTIHFSSTPTAPKPSSTAAPAPTNAGTKSSTAPGAANTGGAISTGVSGLGFVGLATLVFGLLL
jgi:hypothetical protein